MLQSSFQTHRIKSRHGSRCMVQHCTTNLALSSQLSAWLVVEQSDLSSQHPLPPPPPWAPQEFDDKPLPQVLDTQAINRNMLTVQSTGMQGYVMPDSSTINDYQEAYFTVIKHAKHRCGCSEWPNRAQSIWPYNLSRLIWFCHQPCDHFDETIALASIEQRYGKTLNC